MLDFVRETFRGFFNVLLWINLILSTIMGGVIGSLFRGGYVILGIIIGLVFGLFINIVGGGFIATFLEIGEDLDSIKRILSQTQTANSPRRNIPRAGNSPGIDFSPGKLGEKLNFGSITPTENNKKTCKKCRRLIDKDYSTCPHCGSDFLFDE